MKPLLDTALALVWLAAYLGLAYAICRYRYARAQTLGLAGRYGYRIDRDWFARLAVFFLGVVFVALGYLVTRATHP
jgi:hypothetical protein